MRSQVIFPGKAISLIGLCSQARSHVVHPNSVVLLAELHVQRPQAWLHSWADPQVVPQVCIESQAMLQDYLGHRLCPSVG